jgi:hypothetical protein
MMGQDGSERTERSMSPIIVLSGTLIRRLSVLLSEALYCMPRLFQEIGRVQSSASLAANQLQFHYAKGIAKGSTMPT